MNLKFLPILFSIIFTVRSESEACSTCYTIVSLLHQIWGSNTVDSCLADALTFVCDKLKIEDNFVCQGIVGKFKDEFFYIAGRLIVNPEEMCSLIIKDCGKPILELGSNWTIPIPGNKPSVKVPKLPDNSKPKLKVLHISDIHIDSQYTPGTEAECSEPQCCRPPKDINEIVLKSVNVSAPKWGHIGHCDVPYATLENMLQHISKTHNDIDYIVVSGDLESHADWDYTKEGHVETIRNITSLFKTYFPNKKTYMAVGNHEGVPIDNFALHNVPERFNMTWLYGSMADNWKPWIPSNQLEVVRYMGCYTTQLYKGLRLISLNNALGDAVNFFLYINQTDPDGSMSWFAKQLADAEAAGDKVHIVAHIPGGDSEALEGWARNYYNLINRYENIVMAQFFGHTHSEEFYLTFIDMNNGRSRPTSVIYSAPSVTTYSEYNPAYRIYTVDGNYEGSSFQLLDFEEWFLNLTTQGNAESPVWEQLYSSVINEYSLTSLRPTDWNNLLNHFMNYGKDDILFQRYIKNYYRRSNMECDELCYRKHLCSIRQAHHSESLCDDIPLSIQKSLDKKRRRKTKYTTKTDFSHLPKNIEDLKRYIINEIPKDKCSM
ncbi:Sphingomyelin phosphodiesterase [Strongyloides ratti]|uniref:Sphingomyelin phosphodiesterase n=1 Tax=Strongyloides ratti TaxID=34506 RepID=A0A090L7V4_STRRB|nr:Sphingomyelin phosphodiesterase [Strongyloides ratti]CEF63595.1 Sphingomyelin phosphodiesterase [Strongyloides ratti]